MIAHMVTILSILAVQATPNPRPCVSPAEAGAAAAIMLPEMINSFSQACEPFLPEAAFLRTGGRELIERWRTENQSHRELAAAGFTRMMSAATGASAEDTAQAPDPVAHMMEVLRARQHGLDSHLNPTVCKEISRFVEGLAPLPAENVALMVSALAGIGATVLPIKSEDGPPICRP